MRTPGEHMAQQPAFVRDRDRDSAGERLGAAEVVQERRGGQQVGVEPRVQLGGLAAQRRDRHGVLQQAAGVGVVGLGGGGVSHPRADPLVAEEARHQRVQPGMVDLAGEELEKAVERLGVAARSRHQLERIAAVDLLHVAHRDLQPAGVRLDPAQHAHGVALGEARAQHVDVVPDDSRDPPGTVGQLHAQERIAAAGAPRLLALDGEGGIDHHAFAEIGYVSAPGHCGHSI